MLLTEIFRIAYDKGSKMKSGFPIRVRIQAEPNRKLKWQMLVGLITVFAVLGVSIMATEEPKFNVSLRNGAFEVRDYQSAVVAEVIVSGDQKNAASKGFRLLAGYIFGGNSRHQSIAMTAPVAQNQAGEKIEMTAPVTQTEAAGAWVIRFTMPAKYSLDTLPKPNDPRVKLRQVSPARFAVLRFTGLASQPNLAARTAELLAFAADRHLSIIGPVSLAQYNPPWTLWFLRRNEVLIELER